MEENAKLKNEESDFFFSSFIFFHFSSLPLSLLSLSSTKQKQTNKPLRLVSIEAMDDATAQAWRARVEELEVKERLFFTFRLLPSSSGGG